MGRKCFWSVYYLNEARVVLLIIFFSFFFGLVYNEELEDAIEDGYFKSFIKKLMNVSTACSLAVYIMQVQRVEVANGVTCM